MKFNGSIFSKPQQDQLKENIGNELEKVSANMLNYKGNWIDGDEYHENDVVTWDNDGHLYEVIKAHTSSDTIKPDNTQYYKAMTSTKLKGKSFTNVSQLFNFITSIEYEKIGSLDIRVGNNFIKLNPQADTRHYSSTIIFNSNGEIRHTMILISPTSVTAFYLNITIDGQRTINNITPQNYTVYYFE